MSGEEKSPAVCARCKKEGCEGTCKVWPKRYGPSKQLTTVLKTLQNRKNHGNY